MNVNLHDIMNGDSMGLPIAHIDSTSSHTTLSQLFLKYCPLHAIKKNSIFIYQFGKSNHVSIKFLPIVFHMKDP